MNKISQEIDLFLENRRAKHLSASTVNWYAQQLSTFSRYVDECGLPADDPDTIEAFLIAQQKTNISESTGWQGWKGSAVSLWRGFQNRLS